MKGNKPYAAEPIDVWGGGVILFTMIVGSTSHSLQACFDTLALNLTLPDTPWDEPSRGSHEFVQYLTGECFNNEPWTSFSEDMLCTFTLALLILAKTTHHIPLAALITGMLDVEATTRMTLQDVASHPWVTRYAIRSQLSADIRLTPYVLPLYRPSQLAGRSAYAIAQSLTARLRANGDLGIADPQMGGGDAMDTDEDGDCIMRSQRSQFTQSLMFFVRPSSSPYPTDALTCPRSHRPKRSPAHASATRRTSRASSPRSRLMCSSRSCRRRSPRSARSTTRRASARPGSRKCRPSACASADGTAGSCT